MNGHEQPCYYCRKPCDYWAANPGKWPTPLCHSDEPGKMKWHHADCVSDRLERYRILTDPKTPLEVTRSIERIGWLLQRHVELRKESCKHEFAPLIQEEKDDKWFSKGAVCLNCGKDFGWRCKESFKGYCEYQPELGEICMWCGQLEERK